MEYWVIADRETVTGFRFAGVRGDAVETPDEMQRALRSADENPDIGIIIVTEAVAEEVREMINEIRRKERGPVVVEIPGPEGRNPDRPSLMDLIQEALGVRL